MPPPSHQDVPLSAIGALISPERIEALLARWIEDPKECAFVARCILQAGPAHHRGANYVLLLLLAQALERIAPEAAKHEDAEQTVAVPMRLPASQIDGRSDRTYPLAMRIAPLRRLADGDERNLAAMIDCLLDGPPQHALANAAMVNALGLLLAQIPAGRK